LLPLDTLGSIKIATWPLFHADAPVFPPQAIPSQYHIYKTANIWAPLEIITKQVTPTLCGHTRMDKLNEILASYCAKGGKTTKDELLGAAFVVVNKDGGFTRSQIRSREPRTLHSLR
jgi:hypothetical protein